MNSSDVAIPVQTNTMPAYFAAPAEGKHPAVIVLQEIFGVNTQMRRVTDLLARTGYAAVAINYYYRTNPDLDVPYDAEGMKTGFAAAGHLTRANLRTDIAATVAWLKGRPEVDGERIAVWGFCMGGSVAFLTAAMPDIKAAIAFYGGSIAAPFPGGEAPALADATDITAPLFLAYGGKDEHITADHREQAEQALRAAGKPYELKVYEDEGHAFFRESSEALNNPAVADAWERVQRFLGTV